MNKLINKRRFNLSGKSALITGGGGLLGPEHGIALARYGAHVILVDINEKGLKRAKRRVNSQVNSCEIEIFVTDITKENEILKLRDQLKDSDLFVDILINNAALNPKMDDSGIQNSGMVENYDIGQLNKELEVGIIGTFLCCKIFGSAMASLGKGTIVNIASDLAIQAPDQRVYSLTGKIEDVKQFKPVGYPIVKSAMLGLNRYLATYWAHRGVRVNCLVPGAVLTTQSDHLVKNISYRVPLGRLAEKYEYQEAIAFLASDASSYMTGQEIIMDGGRSIW